MSRQRRIPDIDFQIQDIRSLTYDTDHFDVIVASLVLMWFEDLDSVCRELHRVSKDNGGRLIVSLIHPYFYRTGAVSESQDFILSADLSRPFRISGHKIAGRIGPFDYYYRSMDTYLNSLLNAGWNIKRVKDWFADMVDYKDKVVDISASKIVRTGRVPLYTFIGCVKV